MASPRPAQDQHRLPVSRAYDRRATPREQVALPALVLCPEGRTIRCEMIDRSAGGFRINLPAAESLPDGFCLVDLLTGVGYRARLAWRNGELAGARCLDVFDLNAPQHDELGARLKGLRNRTLI